MITLPPARQLRLRPLAACLAAASALGAGSSGSTQAAPRPALAWTHIATGASSAIITNVHSAATPARAFRPLSARGRSGKASASPAQYFVVDNCADSGAGSLRDALDQALSGDSVDLTRLDCSTISLSSGALVTHADHLRVFGPGAAKLTIDGRGIDRVIAHYGSDSLVLDGLTLTNGAAFSGGCIYSEGSVDLYSSVVSSCQADDEVRAVGDGIYVAHAFTMIDSVVTGNNAGAEFGYGYAGGIYAGGPVYILGSTISNNTVGLGRQGGNGGGLLAAADVEIVESTFFGNQAVSGGALYSYGGGTSYLVDSTISGNSAEQVGGALIGGSVSVYNSTIAFNTDQSGRGAGLYFRGAANLQSTIVARNTAGSIASDLGAFSSATLTGANNLIMASALTLPPDTIMSDPLLAPLADNGGPTFNHALHAGSPAVDAGNNTRGLNYDQRDAGFARVVGPAADIGAYEIQSTGVVSVVDTCADSGAGSLRAVAARSLSGDTIDLRALTCSTITLTSGAIDVPQGNLRLLGPSAAALSIEGNQQDRAIHHTGHGTFYASDLTFAHGTYARQTNYATGGCINSASSVVLVRSAVTSCQALAGQDFASVGGGVYAWHLRLMQSTVTGNQAASPAGFVNGGGVFVVYDVTVTNSTISNNIASAGNGTSSLGGGLVAYGPALIDGSTISGNQAAATGGLRLTDPARIANSTISGNIATQGLVAGLEAGDSLELRNSTIAFNTATFIDRIDRANGELPAAGLAFSLNPNSQSTIVFGNTLNQVPADVGGPIGGALDGANNLIGAAAGIPVPPDTLTSDPLLGPLQDNGGPTLTHALQVGSPAIDRGNNVDNFTTDQRGSGFVRSFGAAPDIGAFELQDSGEVIFRDGFD